ncbi:MAG: thiamine pyrophosphate-dependent enzyme [Methanotrichaceae archaeon]|nr:thiamine pyrophosphate-dependent enzyme [Methanotrichaceae archaeon]
MKGLDAVKQAVQDAGVEVITYVPGYPINEIAENLGAEISVNEKVALEIALGASATGRRSMVVVKQVGMNVLADPLVISANHTIGSGLVVIVGDDLGPKGSQAEMDSRYYGLITELPVLDPKNPLALHDSIVEAYRLSGMLRVPAIVRLTSRLISSEGPDIQPFISTGSGQLFEKTSWSFTVRGRHQRHHRDVLPLAEEVSVASTLNSIEIAGKVGIIASGYPAVLAEGLGVSLLAIGYANPLPWKLIRRFVDGHRLILMAEEPEPFIESQLQMSPKVRGKLTGHLPFGPLERSDLVRALECLEEKEVKASKAEVYESAAERGYTGICDDCPYAPLFRALKKLDVPVAGDAGCAIRATREPYGSVDVVYGLGSSIGVALGFGKKGVAVIGDFALAHTGLSALINAVWRKRDVLVVLMNNGVAATTGGQDAPDLTKLLEALVPTCYIELPATEEELRRMLEEELGREGTRAVVALGRCPRH